MPQLCQAVPYEKQRILDEHQKLLYELECYVLLLETRFPQLIDRYTPKLIEVQKRIRKMNRTY